MHTITDLWNLILDDLREDLSEIAIATWFDEVSPVGQEGETFALYCPNRFKRTTIERSYTAVIRKSLLRRFGRELQVRFVSESEYLARETKQADRKRAFRQSDRFTFSTFVVGDSNRMAYNAAQAVAAGFDKYCNPLVVYGDSGLGKTHLLHAIAAAVEASDPDAEIVCLKGDAFTNELVEAIHASTGAQFREKYRHAAVFLMDDVQFIAGKKQTQEEFFNTFEALYESGCSIVLTMDRPPREVSRLEERIASRFEGGLMVEIREPDYETRLEIVKRKAEERGLALSAEDAAQIAGRVTGSIRQIEGILNKLRILAGEDTLSVETVMKTVPVRRGPSVAPESVIEKAAAHYGVDPELVRGKSRTRKVVLARQAAMYVLCQELELSTTQVGRLLRRDHATVCYGLQSVETRMKADRAFAEAMQTLIAVCRQ